MMPHAFAPIASVGFRASFACEKLRAVPIGRKMLSKIRSAQPCRQMSLQTGSMGIGICNMTGGTSVLARAGRFH